MKKILILIILFKIGLLSQSLSIFDINPSNFPIIKAKFYAFDENNKTLIDIELGDFIIKENGISKKVISITCPVPKPPIPLSSVLVVDVSGSMSAGINTSYIDLAKIASKSWINTIQLGQSECALTSFDGRNYLLQDFTTSQRDLLNAINKLEPQGGTSYNAGLLEQMAGGLIISERGRNKKIIIFLTDGLASDTKVNEIINKANLQNCNIFCVTIGMSAPQDLIDISNGTGGKYYENINTQKDIERVYREILEIAYGGDPCEIEWESDEITCTDIVSQKIDGQIPKYGLSTNSAYSKPNASFVELKLSTKSYRFKNPPIDSIVSHNISVLAYNSDFNVTNIEVSNPSFTISPTSFYLTKNDSIQLTISYLAVDSAYTVCKFDFINDKCIIPLFVSGGYIGVKPKVKTIKLVHPNGRENFVVGSDTIITWKGIPNEDLVLLEYSNDEGKNWLRIDTARGLSYIWKNIPRPPSNSCLVKVKQLVGDANNYKQFGELIRSYKESSFGINTINFSPDGIGLAAGNAAGITYFWNIFDNIKLNSYQSKGNIISCIKFNPVTFDLSIASNYDYLRTYNPYSFIETFRYNGYSVSKFCYSFDGSIILSCFGGNTIRIENGINGLYLRTIIDYSGKIIDFDINPNNYYFATGNIVGEIKLWNSKNGDLINTISGHKSAITSISFNHDGSLIASAGLDSTIKIWKSFSGNYVNEFKLYGCYARCIDYSPDGTMIASGNSDGVMMIWNTSNGNVIKSFIENSGSVNDVEFSPDGTMIAAAYGNGSVKVWSTGVNSIQDDESDELFSIVEPYITAQNVDMGLCLVNDTKDSLVTNFVKNSGSYPARIDSIYIQGADASAFSIVSGFPQYSLLKYENHNTEFRFIPTKVGFHNAEIVILTQHDTLIFMITGEGITKNLEILEKIIDFGKVKVRESKDSLNLLTIKNIGSVPIEISGTKHNFPNIIDFSTISGGGSFTLQPSESREMSLRFSPSKIGRTNGTLEFYYTGVGSPASIQLFGEGLKGDPKILSKVSVTLNLVCESSSITNINITNIGGSDLEIRNITISGNDVSDFSISQLSPIIVHPDSTFFLPITFYPQSQGLKSINVNFETNIEKDSIITLNVSAKKELISFKAKEENIDLGLLCPGERKDFTLELENIGTITSSLNVTGDNEIEIDSINEQIKVQESRSISGTFTGLFNEGKFTRKVGIENECGNFIYINITGSVKNTEIQANNVDILGKIGEISQGKIEVISGERSTTITEINGFDSPFTLLSNTFPIIIPPNSKKDIYFEYLPISAVNTTSTITIVGEPCDIRKEVQLNGKVNNIKFQLELDEYSAYVGEEINIPVILNFSDDLKLIGDKSLSTELSFNPTLLTPLDYPIIFVDEKTAKIELNNISISSITNNKLLDLKFFTGLGNSETCNLTLLNSKLVGASAEINVVNGKFTTLGICKEGGTRLINPNHNAKLLSISPNPSNGVVNITLNLFEKGESILEIYSVNGQLKERKVFTDEIGEKVIKLNIDKYNSGMYIVELRTPTSFRNEKLIINK